VLWPTCWVSYHLLEKSVRYCSECSRHSRVLYVIEQRPQTNDSNPISSVGNCRKGIAAAVFYQDLQRPPTTTAHQGERIEAANRLTRPIP
jgi:hypothetical protein